MSKSRLFEALVRNELTMVEALLKGGQSLAAGEYRLLTGQQRALLEAIKSKIAAELVAESEEDDAPSAPSP